jgi:hypothetical protein
MIHKTAKAFDRLSLLQIVGPDRYFRTIAATLIYIEARRELDAEKLVDQLGDNAIFESQDAFEPLIGKEAISAYIWERFDFLRKEMSPQELGHWWLGEIDLPTYSSVPCAVFELDGVRQAITFVACDGLGLIARVDITCGIPSPAFARAIQRTLN